MPVFKYVLLRRSDSILNVLLIWFPFNQVTSILFLIPVCFVWIQSFWRYVWYYKNWVPVLSGRLRKCCSQISSNLYFFLFVGGNTPMCTRKQCTDQYLLKDKVYPHIHTTMYGWLVVVYLYWRVSLLVTVVCRESGQAVCSRDVGT